MVFPIELWYSIGGDHLFNVVIRIGRGRDEKEMRKLGIEPGPKPNALLAKLPLLPVYHSYL